MHQLAADAGKRIVFYCAFGERSAMAVQAAQDAGLLSAVHIQGGMDAWKKADGPVARLSAPQCRNLQNLREKQLGPLVLRVLEEFLGRIRLDDLARVHENDAVGDLAREAHLVAHHQHGHAVLGERDHGVEHLFHHFRIERRGRLVEQHELRIHAERARDRDALLLAAR